MKKKKSNAFGKDIYLLGKFKDGKYFWLEEAKWDCGWYWGFGYIETYTNNRSPSNSKDINSHQHYDGLVFQKRAPCVGCGYIHKIGDHPEVEACVLDESGQWELSDLMKSFYTLRKTAALFNKGNSHLQSPELNLKDEKLEDHINKKLIPQIIEAVIRLLTP